MLGKEFNEIVLIGSNSDIGISIVNQLPVSNTAKLYLVGKTNPLRNRFMYPYSSIEFAFCDLENLTDVKSLFLESSKYSNVDLVILAAGYLPSENLEFDLNSVEKTLTINTLSSIILLSGFVKLMKDGKGGRILVISSVAATRPRLRNFTYGTSKKALDFYANGLQNRFSNSAIKISILRPGFVYSKMTAGFNPAPFALEQSKVAEIAVRALLKNKEIIYAPKKLRMIMKLVKLFPRIVFNKLG
jgi:decaprenylphospho-beta-D-erythro-pentofuranosid-2-ulose 2-reductase